MFLYHVRPSKCVKYQQIHGTAMGSPVSVVITNLVMEYVEDKAFQERYNSGSDTFMTYAVVYLVMMFLYFYCI